MNIYKNFQKTVILSIVFMLFFANLGLLPKSFGQSVNKNDVDSKIEDKIEDLTNNKIFDSSTVLVKYKPSKEINNKGNVFNNPISVEEVDQTNFDSEVMSIKQNNKKTISESDMKVADSNQEIESVKSKLRSLLKDPDVEYAEPNYIRYVNDWDTDIPTKANPDDFDITKHWYYEQGKLREYWKEYNCESGGVNCAGNPEVVVAVIDTGLAFEPFNDTDSDGDGEGDYSFSQYIMGIPGGKNYSVVSPEYSPSAINIFTNPDEYPNNGIDDDCNGVIDDTHGVDTYALRRIYSHPNYVDFETCNNGAPINYSDSYNGDLWKMGHPIDTYGHGSFVTGSIAGKVDNPSDGPLVSPAFNVTIMPIAASVHYERALFSSDIIAGVYYAIENGANIINLSLGGPSFSQFESDLYEYAQSVGIFVVAASGNDNNGNGEGQCGGVCYPAAYDSVLSVGAVNANESRSSYSNYGSNLDIVAYVGNVAIEGSSVYQDTLACYPNCDSSDDFTLESEGKYSTGTSFASPQVAAAAAIAKSIYPNATVDELKSIILGAVDDINTPGYDNFTGHGVLNYDKINDEFIDRELDTNYYFPWYDDSDSGGTLREAWILVANQSQLYDAEIEIYFDGVLRHQQTIEPGGRITPQFDEQTGGPIFVTSTNGVPIFTSQRVRYINSFNEMAGIPTSSMDTQIYFPWYDDSDSGGTLREAWILVGNPSETQTANVSVTVGGNTIFNGQVLPGESVTPQWNEQVGGPVVVTSNEVVYATQRVRYINSFNEMAGIPTSSMDTQIYFPWYDDSDSGGTLREAWVLVGNPSQTETANVIVTVGGNTIFNGQVLPGESVTPQWNEQVGGPVIVTSNEVVYATQRVRYINSFNEMVGVGSQQLNRKQYFPWYDDSDSGGTLREAWVLVGNPSQTETANVIVTVGGNTIFNGQVLPGESVTPQWNEQVGGPVIVISTVDIFTSTRVRYLDSFNEITGL